MGDSEQRKNELIRRIAERAYAQPLLDSGLWFHRDIRDNYYYASYLFAAAVDPDVLCGFDRERAAGLAADVLLKVLRLQGRNPDDEMYGHLPLNLQPSPREAKKHVLPVELMGSLMAVFLKRYEDKLPQELKEAFEEALVHAYRSRFYAKEVRAFNHHEAKYTATKLIFGSRYGDVRLLADGHDSLRRTLAHNRANGMTEYGALPWFWHWVQAFAAAYELVNQPQIRADLRDMLDSLWRERARFYLKGAWVGPHSRAWPHDIPRDGNVLFDYVQFGDFPLPEEMPRTEYAGFLYYEAPEDARSLALRRERAGAVEVKAISRRAGEEAAVHAVARKYVYITPHYAAGGVWERFEEFDNEQQRWDFTFPADGTANVNQAYFFHPGRMYGEGDARHQSVYCEVLFCKNVIMALYPIPEKEKERRIVGVLPPGEWLAKPYSLYGFVRGVYLAVRLNGAYTHEDRGDRILVTGGAGTNAVVMEAVTAAEAESAGLSGLERFAAALEAKPPVYREAGGLQTESVSLTGDAQEKPLLSREADGLHAESVSLTGDAQEKPPLSREVDGLQAESFSLTGDAQEKPPLSREADGLHAEYVSLSGDALALSVPAGKPPVRLINGAPVDFSDYAV